MSEDALFGGYDPSPKPEISDDARRALRQQAGFLVGWHPVGGRVHPDADRERTPASGKRDPLTCGSCQLRGLVGGHAKSFPKCLRPGARITKGPATDVRAWWPACLDYQPKEPA